MTDVQKPRHASIGAAVLDVMSHVGYVQKKKTPGLNYSFAGEADLIAALRPHMLDAGIVMQVVEYVGIERFVVQTSSGKSQNVTTLKAIVRFSHPDSNTWLDVQALGEGADTGDKSANKAMTCAYKYALRQLFVIETGDDPDKDQNNEYQQDKKEPKAKPEPASKPDPRQEAIDTLKRLSNERILTGIWPVENPDELNLQNLQGRVRMAGERLTVAQFAAVKQMVQGWDKDTIVARIADPYGVKSLGGLAEKQAADLLVRAKTGDWQTRDKGFDEP